MPVGSRAYTKYLPNALRAIHSGVERANAINDPYYKEASIILIANAWELLAKSVLIKHAGEAVIYETGSRKERTITAEVAINKLKNLGYISNLQAAPLQQIISLRNEASHQSLPDIPDELLFHLEYYSIRYFREVLDANFKQYSRKLRANFLSVSFSPISTYAESVKKLVTRARKSKKNNDIRLTYLLERGISFSGGEYMKQADFEKALLNKSTTRPMYKLNLGDYSRNADMIVIVPIQAPSGTKADIKLSKGRGSNISIAQIKRATDDDYPYLTKDLSTKLGKSSSYVSKTISNLSLKGNILYHQQIRAGSKSLVHKYSDSCLLYLRKFYEDNPDYAPFKKGLK